MHYPASDIPQQARELYKLNRIRVLYDRDAETALLVCVYSIHLFNSSMMRLFSAIFES
jgi:light-regulated signal transduction histidine kinase (bacteriophytochrome)